jgi:glycerol-3-phosphate dehydrogenase
MENIFDVIIIGGGIVGCATARFLSRYALDVLLLEQGADISIGATKANSGILHAGYDCTPGTQKAKLNVQGLHMYKQLVGELNIPHRINGSLVVSTREGGLRELQALYNQGLANGISNMELLNAEETRTLEPNLHPSVNGALRAADAGIISPYEAAVAFAENAAVNGVKFVLNTTVTAVAETSVAETTADGLTKPGRILSVNTSEGVYFTRTVINAAGVSSGIVANFLQNPGEPPVVINPQRGQYYLFDNTQKGFIHHTVFQLPTRLGKGVLIAPTVDDNILLGPTAETVDNNPTATETTREGLSDVLAKARLALADVPLYDRITAFAGVRAKHAGKDFIIKESPAGFIHAIGIDSPGLTAAPAIAARLVEYVLERLNPSEKSNFVKERPTITRFRDLSPDEQTRLVAANPAYGQIVCRCETITQTEILDAMRRPVAAKNLDAIKRRTRAQMGRCQGGFCTLRLVELLSREFNIPETEVTKNGAGSEIKP